MFSVRLVEQAAQGEGWEGAGVREAVELLPGPHFQHTRGQGAAGGGDRGRGRGRGRGWGRTSCCCTSGTAAPCCSTSSEEVGANSKYADKNLQR